MTAPTPTHQDVLAGFRAQRDREQAARLAELIRRWSK